MNRDVQAGRDFYDAVGVALAIPPERMGVPRLVVGDSYLVGSLEIPEQFPALIEEGIPNESSVVQFLLPRRSPRRPGAQPSSPSSECAGR